MFSNIPLIETLPKVDEIFAQREQLDKRINEMKKDDLNFQNSETIILKLANEWKAKRLCGKKTRRSVRTSCMNTVML